MKTKLFLALAFSLIFSLAPFSILAENKSNFQIINSEKLLANEFISTEDFLESYTDQSVNVTRTTDNLNLTIQEKTTIPFELISVSETDGFVTLKAGINGSKITISGYLYRSHKFEKDINSLVVKSFSNNSNYKVLYFEILNDIDQFDTRFVSKASNHPMIKIYLHDIGNDKLILVEDSLPAELSELHAQNYKKSEPEFDMFWFTSFYKGKQNDLPLTHDNLTMMGINTIQAAGLNSWSTTMLLDRIIHTQFNVGGTIYDTYSIPYLEHRHVDVRSSDSTWTAAFKIAEHTHVQGPDGSTFDQWGTNVVSYKNIQIGMASGNRSVFIRTYQEGRMLDDTAILPWDKVRSEGEKIAVSLLTKAINTLPGGNIYTTILGYFNSMTSSNGNVTLGSTGITLSNRRTFAVAERLNSKHRLHECTDYNGNTNNGHYFTYQAVLSYENNPNGSRSQIGAFQVKFTVVQDNIYTDYTKNIQLDYAAWS